MSPGDKVRTLYGEEGVINHAWDQSDAYDWWVQITFQSKKDGKTYQSLEMYRESELEILEQKS